MKVPQCLNTDFFKTVVRNGFHLTDFQIADAKIEIGTSAGDNYCSTIYRVFLSIIDSQANHQKVQFLIKHLLSSDTGESLMKFMHTFGKEVDMIKNIMPRLTKITGGTQFVARFYHSYSEPQSNMIIVQDLKELQYRMADRKEALDYDHCCVALTKLGQMHAASMILTQDNPSLMDNYKFGILHGSENNPGLIQQILGANYPALCKVSKNWVGFEDISQKLNDMQDKFWRIVYECQLGKNDKYKVLNHGDFWINNFLFKYNEETGKPIDTLFVDLQLSYYASPANDLQYFLNTSPQIQIRRHQREDLLRVYYKSFRQTLRELNHKIIPTFDDLLAEVRQWEMFGFMSAVFVLPLVLMEKQSTQGSGIDGLVDPEAVQEMTQIMFSGKRFTEAMQEILRRCDEMKLFDSL
ncbi:uncharacterized protein LOC132264721 [Phlebotomus argentipes]|uniref:uncharacterized protein LOC132264721 n=1 Tax=Phlebotomus argentipes TaxID=94469 RepID=UPI0028934E30|nr:uncharacterized protein LOC132264721 [Phlebotomus argentipes]